MKRRTGFMGMGMMVLLAGSGVTGQLQIQVIDAHDDPFGEEAVEVEAPAVEGHGGGEERVRDVLMFLNGDRMQGKFLGVDGEGWVQFGREDVREPMAFRAEGVYRVELAEGEEEQEAEPMRVALRGGDVISGEVVSMDGETLVLRSGAAGELAVRREMLAGLEPAQRADILYQGPGGREGWEITQGGEEQWTFGKEGLSFEGNHGFAGLLLPELPERFVVEMDLRWRGQLNVQIGLMALDPQNPHSGAWALMLQREHVRMFRYGGRGGQGDLGNTRIEELARKNAMQLALYVDKGQKRISMGVDGQLMYEWLEAKGFRPSGDGLVFMGQHGSQWTVSRVEVRAWDGKFPAADGGAGDQDVLVLVNGDRISGRVTGIAAGRIAVDGEFNVFEFPVERLTEVRFAAGESAELPAVDTPVRVGFGSGDHLTLALREVSGDGLSGRSPVLGEVTLGRGWMTQLDFNWGDERREVLDGARRED